MMVFQPGKCRLARLAILLVLATVPAGCGQQPYTPAPKEPDPAPTRSADDWRKQLDDPDEEKQKEAVAALYDAGALDLEQMLAILGTKPLPVASILRGKLRSQGTKAIPLYVAMLGDDRWYVQNTARGELGDLGQDALPAIHEALKNPNPKVRAGAAAALSRAGEKADKDVRPELWEMLKDPEARVQVTAAQELWFPDRERRKLMLPHVLAGLKDADPAVRLQAAELLHGRDVNMNGRGEITFPDGINDEPVAALRGATKDPDRLVRVLAARGLIDYGWDYETAVPVLLEGLNEGEKKWVVLQTFQGLTGKEEIIPPQHRAARAAAVPKLLEALVGQLLTRPGVKELPAEVKLPRSQVKSLLTAAEPAVARPLVAKLVAALDDPDEHVRGDALEVLKAWAPDAIPTDKK
jgi:HEAT repeat protein